MFYFQTFASKVDVKWEGDKLVIGKLKWKLFLIC